MTVVFWQRYPEDIPSTRFFESDGDAEGFASRKREDYRYTVGRVWTTKVQTGRQP
jgi:hypothetical protein